jgi:hypothetical protein
MNKKLIPSKLCTIIQCNEVCCVSQATLGTASFKLKFWNTAPKNVVFLNNIYRGKFNVLNKIVQNYIPSYLP